MVPSLVWVMYLGRDLLEFLDNEAINFLSFQLYNHYGMQGIKMI